MQYKRTAVRIAGLVAAFAVSISTTLSTAEESDYHSPYYFSCQQLSSAIAPLANSYREISGLRGLKNDQVLASAASEKARDMASRDYFAHSSPFDGKNDFDFMDDAGAPNAWQGSNLAFLPYTTDAAGTAFRLWKGSPGHNKNMLNPKFSRMGIGTAFDEGSATCYVAQFLSE